jgi:hypothetical protein
LFATVPVLFATVPILFAAIHWIQIRCVKVALLPSNCEVKGNNQSQKQCLRLTITQLSVSEFGIWIAKRRIHAQHLFEFSPATWHNLPVLCPLVEKEF